jgi:hydrogenase expression/formation protein HypD
MSRAENVGAKLWLERIRGLPLNGRIRVMNVCGGHERSISLAGLRGALPKEIELIPGPGCPVCVCPEEDVHAAIQLALRKDVILVAFGDMLRVPANVPKHEPRSLEQARAAGGAVRPIASPREAVKIAKAHPDREVVFFAAGFETTTAPVAGLIAEGLPPNLSILLSGRLTWPAVAMLLESEEAGFDALIAPGHVSTIMGPEEWEFVPLKHGIPSAVAGFESDSLLAALYSVLRQRLEGKRRSSTIAMQCRPTRRQSHGAQADRSNARCRGFQLARHRSHSALRLRPETRTRKAGCRPALRS